jgi:hemerythrin-like domain-containing protein
MFPTISRHADPAGMTTYPVDAQRSLEAFSRCHEGIVEQLRTFSALPALAAAAERSRQVAAATLALFENGVMAHHGDEESELFPAVLRWARPGAEQEKVKALIGRLTQEHRQIENLWKRSRAAVEALARGKPAELEKGAAMRLVQVYLAHARFEESEFLPLAEEILGRDSAHLAALGMSLHLRHAPHIAGYI